MIRKNEMIFQKDLANKKIFVSRNFDAPRANVWKAWTTSELLDQWWAPQPFQAFTKAMQFKEGGFWLYYMQGPDSTKMWARIDYEKIDAEDYFTQFNSFCDEDGNIDTHFSKMHGKNTFSNIEDGTKVEIEMTFEKVEDLHKLIEMGFELGFTAALNVLAQTLKAQLKIS